MLRVIQDPQQRKPIGRQSLGDGLMDEAAFLSLVLGLRRGRRGVITALVTDNSGGFQAAPLQALSPCLLSLHLQRQTLSALCGLHLQFFFLLDLGFSIDASLLTFFSFLIPNSTLSFKNSILKFDLLVQTHVYLTCLSSQLRSSSSSSSGHLHWMRITHHHHHHSISTDNNNNSNTRAVILVIFISGPH